MKHEAAHLQTEKIEKEEVHQPAHSLLTEVQAQVHQTVTTSSAQAATKVETRVPALCLMTTTEVETKAAEIQALKAAAIQVHRTEKLTLWTLHRAATRESQAPEAATKVETEAATEEAHANCSQQQTTTKYF